MSKNRKSEKSKEMENFIKVYASLRTRKDWSTRRPLVMVAQIMAKSGKPKAELREDFLVAEKYFGEHSGDVLKWFSNSVDQLINTKLCQGKNFFEDHGGNRTTRSFVLNREIDFKKEFLALDCVPEIFFKTFAYKEKALDLVVASIVFGRDYLEELAATGHFSMPLKKIATLTGGSYSSRNIYETAIKNVNLYTSESGIRMRASWPKRITMEKLLKEGVIDVFLEGNQLVNYLAAFGMEPAVQKSEAPEIIPAIPEPAVEAQQLKFSSNEFENLLENFTEGDAATFEKMASIIRLRLSRKVDQT